MRTRPTAMLVVAVLVAAVFFGLWVLEKNDHAELETLCQASAAQALADFSRYEELGHEGDYWYGVSNFKTFLNSWLVLEEKSSAEYLWCNNVYGCMVLAPEKVQVHMDQLITAMRILAKDYSDQNGYLKMSELNNLLMHE